MTIPEFLYELDISKHYIEETEDKIIIKDNHCRIEIIKKLLHFGICGGIVYLNILGKELQNEFNKYIHPGCINGLTIPIEEDFYIIFNSKQHTKEEFPVWEIGTLLGIYAYSITSLNDKSLITYVITNKVKNLPDFPYAHKIEQTSLYELIQ